MAEYVPPSKAPETEAARARLQKHTAFLSGGNAWTAAHVQDIEAGLRDGGWAARPGSPRPPRLPLAAILTPAPSARSTDLVAG